tara:strand:+ start:1175 stop:2038 length:864 start_codon:yes stop_codon:yes gene_type:complete
MPLKNIIKSAVPTLIGAATGGPIAAASAFYNSQAQQRAQKREQKQIDRFVQNQRQQEINMAEIFGSGNVSSIQPTKMGTTANAGFGAGFGNFLTDLGQNIVNPFLNLVSPFTNKFTGSNVTQPAITTPTIGGGGQETPTSGTNDAFIGGAGNLISGASRFLKSPGGGFLTGLFGGALPGLIDPNTGQSKRITRKMKSQARMLLNMTGGNLQATAEMLNISQEELVFILLKRFRNDGPVVTKAALRKTKQTIRRLHNMQDVLKSITPTSTGRRRTPMKRAMSTTLIKN